MVATAGLVLTRFRLPLMAALKFAELICNVGFTVTAVLLLALTPPSVPVLTSNPAASGRTGAGTFSYRIYRNCDPFGNNATQFEGNIPV